VIIHNDFIGLNETNASLPFLPGDTEALFLQNVRKEKNDWYYKDLEISYDLNDNGHRSKNIKDINLSNYILFTGCSHTTGIGIELEKSYPYIVAKTLGCDYYNLSMPGAGIDVMEYNLLTWFSTVKYNPKLVIVQMPDHSRYCNLNPYINSSFLVESGSWASEKEELQMILNFQDIGFFDARKFFTYENIKNTSPSPIIMFNVFGQENKQINPNDLKMRDRDKARDLSHFGILSNAEFANNLADYIKKYYPE
jgi:hypothetical protein